MKSKVRTSLSKLPNSHVEQLPQNQPRYKQRMHHIEKEYPHQFFLVFRNKIPPYISDHKNDYLRDPDRYHVMTFERMLIKKNNYRCQNLTSLLTGMCARMGFFVVNYSYIYMYQNKKDLNNILAEIGKSKDMILTEITSEVKRVQYE